MREEISEYLLEVLEGVSRSFVLIIPALEYPLNIYIGAAYAIFRVCDNIEDCGEPVSWKQERFGELKELLKYPEEAEKILKRWDKFEWRGLTERERELMRYSGGSPLWNYFSSFPENIREEISYWALEMIRGMEGLSTDRTDLAQTKFQDYKVLSNWEDFDRYCYYVAGTVGYLCTKLASIHYSFSDELERELSSKAEAFGRALQKINILKDFYLDLKDRKISYIPYQWHLEEELRPLKLEGSSPEGRIKLFTNIGREIKTGAEYISLIPLDAKGYRFFCLGALIPAKKTLLEAQKRAETLFTPRHYCKIDRSSMAQSLLEAEEYSRDNELFEENFLKPMVDALSNREKSL